MEPIRVYVSACRSLPVSMYLYLRRLTSFIDARRIRSDQVEQWVSPVNGVFLDAPWLHNTGGVPDQWRERYLRRSVVT
jgi:hypothetical protein